MRRLLVAAAVSLTAASEPFSWADAQDAMHACTNGSRPLVDKYAYLSTRHPLGNALSGWRARARAVAAARPHHRKNLSPREVAAAIADEVGRGK